MKIEIDGKEYVEKDYRNSRYRNSGYCNSGDGNLGDRNSGYRNSGYWNSGDWNSGDRNSGYCNSNSPTLRFFNKETELISIDNINFPDYFYFDLTEWVDVSDMTAKEKEEYPHYKITTGFLRVFDYKAAWKNSFKKATKKDVKLTLKLPNFDYKVFEEVSGITKKMIDEKLK